MTVLGNPTRKRGIRRIFLAYASGYQVFKQHQFVLAALGFLCRQLKFLAATTDRQQMPWSAWQLMSANNFHFLQRQDA